VIESQKKAKSKITCRRQVSDPLGKFWTAQAKSTSHQTKARKLQRAPPAHMQAPPECNTSCFSLAATSANDHFNQVFNYPWSTFGQTLDQNPSQPLDLPCPSRTFVTFSKIHLNTSISSNVKVLQFVEAHNFHVGWHF
jgi:hypothetical protein